MTTNTHTHLITLERKDLAILIMYASCHAHDLHALMQALKDAKATDSDTTHAARVALHNSFSSGINVRVPSDLPEDARTNILKTFDDRYHTVIGKLAPLIPTIVEDLLTDVLAPYDHLTKEPPHDYA